MYGLGGVFVTGQSCINSRGPVRSCGSGVPVPLGIIRLHISFFSFSNMSCDYGRGFSLFSSSGRCRAIRRCLIVRGTVFPSSPNFIVGSIPLSKSIITRYVCNCMLYNRIIWGPFTRAI